MKPTLRLGFTDYFDSIDKFFTDVLSRRFDIVRDDENPEYLIFCDENFGRNNINYNGKCVKIFYSGENRRYQNYACHFAITADHSIESRHFRLPLYVVDNWVYTEIIGLPDVTQVPRNELASKKTGFCSFIVKNPGCAERNNAFETLSKYKHIDSPGPHFNNCDPLVANDIKTWHTSKLEFIKARKFNLCYENASYPGWVTEKLYQALYAGTVPIYWGSPTVEMDFNHKAFLSRHNYDSDMDFFNAVVKLDSNTEKYNEMLHEPIVASNNRCFDLDRMANWFYERVYQK